MSLKNAADRLVAEAVLGIDATVLARLDGIGLADILRISKVD